MKKTKIICTMGPETNDKDTIEALIKSGMNGARLSFSNGGYEDHKTHINMIKAVREELGTHTAIILDIKSSNNEPEIYRKGNLSEKDICDLKFGVENEVDIITASYINNPEDIEAIRSILRSNGGEELQVYAKIETQEGIDNIDTIIAAADGIMVARGHLGDEIPVADIPAVQKMIIERCNVAGVPVITATQMMESMVLNPRPTRAEASDVANAIFDGTDAVMLSNETAYGKYPVESVKTMTRIAVKAEEYLKYDEHFEKRKKRTENNVPNAISEATCDTAKQLNAKAIITATQSGKTAKNISKYKPKCTIIACTPNERVARRLSLSWGVLPILIPKVRDTDELINTSSQIVLRENYVNKNDLVIFVAGIPINYVGSTNMMKVHII